jgi:hypothetical protein
MHSALAECVAAVGCACEVVCEGVDGEPFTEPVTVVTRPGRAGTIFVRRDQLAALSELRLSALLARELVHLERRDDLRRWLVTAITLFLLVAGSATVALLRLCLGWRTGAVELLGSMAGTFVAIPTAVFLLQYFLHDIEYDADRELVRRSPSLTAALVAWLGQEEVSRPHPFVVIPHLVPHAADRLEHLRRLSEPRPRGTWMRPLSALGAAMLLILVGVALAELVHGKVPDVGITQAPGSAARDATASARQVQNAVAAFDAPPSAEREAARIREVTEEVQALRRAFDQPPR